MKIPFDVKAKESRVQEAKAKMATAILIEGGLSAMGKNHNYSLHATYFKALFQHKDG